MHTAWASQCPRAGAEAAVVQDAVVATGASPKILTIPLTTGVNETPFQLKRPTMAGVHPHIGKLDCRHILGHGSLKMLDLDSTTCALSIPTLAVMLLERMMLPQSIQVPRHPHRPLHRS